MPRHTYSSVQQKIDIPQAAEEAEAETEESAEETAEQRFLRYDTIRLF